MFGEHVLNTKYFNLTVLTQNLTCSLCNYTGT